MVFDAIIFFNRLTPDADGEMQVEKQVVRRLAVLLKAIGARPAQLLKLMPLDATQKAAIVDVLSSTEIGWETKP